MGGGQGKRGYWREAGGSFFLFATPHLLQLPPPTKYTTPSFQHLGEGVLWADISPPELTSYPLVLYLEKGSLKR